MEKKSIPSPSTDTNTTPQKKSPWAIPILLSLVVAVGIAGYSAFAFKKNIEKTKSITLEAPISAEVSKTPVAPQEIIAAEKRPQIQISEETKNQNLPSMELEAPSKKPEKPDKPLQKNSLPNGFGMEGVTTPPVTKETSEVIDTSNKDQNNTKATSAFNLDSPKKEQSSILEAPSDPATTKEDKTKSIESIDPRTIGVTANDGPDKNYEDTSLTVQRTLTAILENGDRQLIRLKVPVMYKSRYLSFNEDRRNQAIAILKKLKEEREKLVVIKKDLEDTLTTWNKLVEQSTPNSALLPESPSLPQNQGASKLNREDNPNMAPGKAISYEVIANKK